MQTDKKTFWFILGILSQILIIGLLVIYHVAILNAGTQLTLDIVPVDPRSPLRGDYVTFDYDISNVRMNSIRDGEKYVYNNTSLIEKVKEGTTVYTVLTDRGFETVMSHVQLEKPESGEIFLKGVVSEVRDLSIHNSAPNIYQMSVDIEYGIEQYFIPEGSGQQSDLFARRDNQAVIVVDKDGNAVIKYLVIDGKKWPK